ncbi:S24 family peptidase [Phocaeicola coprocola]|uniref:S24/S26 family peptidase n=1 Tax=Phocaeicola coprocola TaxID=310298 RepID=A0A921FDZ5_9BACT|nr:S24/S26 family peptidase [Phocaeicola coprocola]
MEQKEIFVRNDVFFTGVQEMLRLGKSVRIRVRGSSMLPFLRHNDDALLAPPEGKRIRRGTVVVAQTDESGIVLHRIRRIDRDGRITLLGDGNTRIFEHTDRSRIIAVVTRYYRGRHSFSPENPLMRFVGLLWCEMHPWRRHLLNVIWKLKKLITA